MILSSWGWGVLPWWLRQWRIFLQRRKPRFNPWVGKILWRKEWQPTLVFLPGEFRGQRSLVGYSPWGHRESDMTQWLTLSIFLIKKKKIQKLPVNYFWIGLLLSWRLGFKHLCIQESRTLLLKPHRLTYFQPHRLLPLHSHVALPAQACDPPDCLFLWEGLTHLWLVIFQNGGVQRKNISGF